MTRAGDIPVEPALVDRAMEIEVLGRAVADQAAGWGHAVVIEGPPGIGKTALLDLVRNLSRSAGFQLLEVRGTELSGDISYGAVRELFAAADQQMLDDVGLDHAARSALDDTVDPAVDPPGEFAALQALHRATVALARNEPLVLVADDAHWIDPTSLRYFAYLASMIGRQSLLLVVATRPHAEPARKAALDQLLTSPMVEVLRPRILGPAATDQLLTGRFGVAADPTFAAVCHRETGGNPLLLKQLAATLADAGVMPTAANATAVRLLGSRSVRTYVGDLLTTCGASDVAILQAVAILGDGAAVDQVAELAGNATTTEVTEALAGLAARGLLTGAGAGTEFVHPLIRAAIYEAIDPAVRATLHVAAADLLTKTGAGVESVAAHYLRDSAGAGPARSADEPVHAAQSSSSASTVVVLRRAAAQAQSRGAPESALRYLRRGLAEIGNGPERDDMVLAAGRAAYQVDLPNSLEYLAQALNGARDPATRFRLLGELFGALLLTGRISDGLELVRGELDRLPAPTGPDDPYDDVRRYLGAGMALVAINNASLSSSSEMADLMAMPPSAGLGGRTLDGTLAMYQAFRACPEAVERATRAVSDEVLLAVDNGRGPRMMALDVLLVADQPKALGLLDAAVLRASREGSLLAVSGAYTYRGRGFLVRGELDAAHRDATTARWATGICRLENRSFVAQVLADTCLEMGRWDQARRTLEWSDVLIAPPSRPFTFFALVSFAGLERMTGNAELGLQLALLAGERFAAAGGINPALVGWRYEAALCRYSLGDQASAIDLAAQNLSIARQWGAPRSLGMALRLVAAVGDIPDQLRTAHLTEAVDLLRPTAARLELAECLVARGRLKSAAGLAASRLEGFSDLAEGLALARRCGAIPLADRARAIMTPNW